MTLSYEQAIKLKQQRQQQQQPGISYDDAVKLKQQRQQMAQPQAPLVGEEALHKIGVPRLEPRSFGEVLRRAPGQLMRTAVGAPQVYGEALAGMASLIPGIDVKPPQKIVKETPEAQLLGGGAAYGLLEALTGGAATPLIGARIASKIPGVVGRMVPGAIYGAGVAPKEQRGLGALIGAGISPIADIAAAGRPGIKKAGARALKRFVRPRRAPEEIAALKRTLPEGQKLPAGRLLESGPSRGLESLLEKTPGAGMARPAEDWHLQIKKDLNDYVKRLENRDTADLHGKVYRQMEQGYKKVQKKYQTSLEEFHKAADEPGAQISLREKGAALPNFEKVHRKISGDMADEFESIAGLKHPPADTEKLQGVLEDYEPEKLGKKLGTLRKFEANKKTLNKLNRESKREGNKSTAYHAEKLKDALMEDMRVNTEGMSPEIRNKLRESDAIYRNEVIPYRKINKEDSPFLKVYDSEEKNTDKFLDKYFKAGAQADQAHMLNKITNLADNPEKMKDLIRSYHFRPALKELAGGFKLNPAHFMTQFEKLGTRQKNLLFNPAERKMLESHAVAKQVYPEILNPDWKPPTGWQMAKSAIPILEALVIGGTAVTGHIIPALAMLAGTTAGARGLSKLLRSDVIPNIMKMAEQAPTSAAKRKIIRSGLAGLVPQFFDEKRGAK